MFAFENFQQTIRLLLLGAFEHDEPRLTAQIKEMQRSCPALFKNLLMATPGQPHGDTAYGDGVETDVEVGLVQAEVTSDAEHPKAVVHGKIKAGMCVSEHQLPTRERAMQPKFRDLLSAAYGRDYGTQVAMSTTGGALIKWWKRLSFDDRYVSIPSPEVMDQCLGMRLAMTEVGDVWGMVLLAETVFQPWAKACRKPKLQAEYHRLRANDAVLPRQSISDFALHPSPWQLHKAHKLTIRVYVARSEAPKAPSSASAFTEVTTSSAPLVALIRKPD